MSGSRSHDGFIALVACLLGWLLPLASARAQGTVSVHVNAPSTAYVADAFELQIIVRNARSVERPVVPPSPDYDARDIDGITTAMNITNGVVSQMLTYKSALTPRRVGEITIPPFEVSADGRQYLTNPVTVRVIEPAATADFALEIGIEKARAYVGEPLTLHGRLILGRRIKTLSFTAPQLPAGIEVLEAPDPRPPGTHPQDPRFIRFNIGGDTVVGQFSSTSVGQRRVDQIEFDRIIVPRQPGPLKIGATTARFDVVTGQRTPRFTDGPFADLDITDRQIALSQPIQVEVLPLPTAGQPSDFSGLIGNYTVTASADPRDAAVGEPINLRVTVNGPPPLSLVPLVDLTTQPALSQSFRVPREPALPQMTPVGAMFTYPIRARKPGDQQIPPIQISYFDSDSGTYKMARSEPIRISIRPAPGVEVGDSDDPLEAMADSSANGPAARVDAAALSLSGRQTNWRDLLTEPLAWVLAGIPPVLFASTWLITAMRRRALADPASRRRRRAIAIARRRLRAASAAGDRVAVARAVSSTLADLAADWFNRPSASLTSQEALALLATNADPVAGKLRALLDECDRARFAAHEATSAQEAPSLVVRTRSLLDALSQSLLSRKELPCA